MVLRAVACLVLLLLIGTAAPGAELFYMDHDPFTNQYVGAVGPLVLSGEIIPGDYERLLAKFAEDENRFSAQNKLILASTDGDAAETIKIAKLVKSLYTEVIVGPLTGRCVGACFLIYVAANQRGTDGERLIGIHRSGLADSEYAAMSPTEAALREDSVQDQVRAFLLENAVPGYLIEEMSRHTSNDVYWLSERDEQNLGAKSPSFEKYLAANCGWSDTLERAVYKGERPLDDLKTVWACRARVTQAAAHKALAMAFKEKSARDANGMTPGAKPQPSAAK
jgi:hypothetical protein